MKKFQTMGELVACMVGANAPNELKATAKPKKRLIIVFSADRRFFAIIKSELGRNTKLKIFI